MGKQQEKTTVVLQALFVTFLWSTSWVIVKFGLEDIPPLVFAGLRYVTAFVVLGGYFALSQKGGRQHTPLKKLTNKDWLLLIVLGIVYYTLTQGSQFLGLKYLPAITLSLLLNFTSPVTAVLGLLLLNEKLSWPQWLGIGVFLLGVGFYFYPVLIPAGLALGMAIGVFNLLANSFASILGRLANRAAQISPLTVTVVSMGVGSILLLAVGIYVEGWPRLSLANWGSVVWLAVVNTAFAFYLWNHTLRTLTAAESSMINNTMLIQIAVLAWLFLGEQPGLMQWLGMGIVTAGVVMVNMGGGKE